jgi:hypothetical protein
VYGIKNKKQIPLYIYILIPSKNNQKTDLSKIIQPDNDLCFFAVFMILSYLDGLYKLNTRWQ